MIPPLFCKSSMWWCREVFWQAWGVCHLVRSSPETILHATGEPSTPCLHGYEYRTHSFQCSKSECEWQSQISCPKPLRTRGKHLNVQYVKWIVSETDLWLGWNQRWMTDFPLPGLETFDGLKVILCFAISPLLSCLSPCFCARTVVHCGEKKDCRGCGGNKSWNQEAFRSSTRQGRTFFTRPQTLDVRENDSVYFSVFQS